MKGKTLIIFDLDGTLFRTETIDIVAINRALAANGLKGKSEAEILDSIGMIMPDICRAYGITDEKTAVKFSEDVLNFEIEGMKDGRLYPGAAEFLRKLKANGHTLCICSNGSDKYVEGVTGNFGIAGLFTELWGHKEGYTKSDAVGCLARKYSRDGFIMVGDRTSDIEAGRDNGGITIGAAYGFGGTEAYAADYTARSIAELEEIIYKLTE